MKKSIYFIIFILAFSLLLSGCGSGGNSNSDKEIEERDKKIAELEEELKVKDEKIAELEERIRELEEEEDEGSQGTENLISLSMNIMEYIKEKDMNEVSQYVHPTKGLRFTPYFNVDIDNDKVFTAEEVKDLMENQDSFNWGNYDGSGEPINLSFNDYYNEFVYDEDFINPQIIGNNTPIGEGNTIDNINEAYPDGEFIEFHFAQIDPQYEGIDWKSLRLVFDKSDGDWYLVGIVHGQWTI